MLPAILDFDGVSLSIIDRQGQPWVAFPDVIRALYGIKGGDSSVTPFANAERAMRRLFDKNRDEFTDEMTIILTMETAGGPQQVRIFSARGCYLMAMLAKTERAKAFRRWVLDVLDGKVGVSAKQTLAERRVRVMELNAATRALQEIEKAGGQKAAAANAPAIYAKVNLRIDMSMSSAFAQGELPLQQPANFQSEVTDAA